MKEPRKKEQQGIALVVVLWVLVLLAMIAANFTVGTRTSMRLAGNHESSARAEALADAGVARALMGLATRRSTVRDADTAVEIVGRPEEPAALPVDGASWPLDGTPVAWEFEDAVIAVAVTDEGGKIDLNAARDDLLRGLFESVGVIPDDAAALTDAVRDFTDGDDLRRARGAEAQDYRAAGLADPKNARFEAVQELLQVYGMTPEIYRAAAPALTIYSGRPGFDPRVAAAPALLALPDNDFATVEETLAARTENPDSSSQALRRNQLVSRSRGQVFRVDAEVATADGARFMRSAVVRVVGRRESSIEILRWERAFASPPTLPEQLEEDADPGGAQR